jgi:hypothetical protein
MPFVQGSAIEKASKGSAESRLDAIHRCVHEHYTETPLGIMATFDDHVLAFAADHKLLKISYSVDESGEYSVTGEKVSRAIPVIMEDDVANTVAKNLRQMAKAMMSGKLVPRTQVREMAALVRKDEMYWMSDIVSKLDEATDSAVEWYKMYEANIDRIRTSMHGRIREIEGAVPKTRYVKIPASKLASFKSEMGESLQVIKGLLDEQCMTCGDYIFGDKQEFLSAVRESLIAEAQAVVGLLGRAEKLMGHADLSTVANAHDKLADRAKAMALVSSYLGSKAQPKGKEN